MGMFDEIVCKYPLPNPASDDENFQTKDMDCAMERYDITPEGRLIRHHWQWEETPQAEKPYPNATEGLEVIIGMIRRKEGSHRLVDMNYHGMLYFYGDAGEYTAKFTDGKIVEVKRLEKDDD